MREHSDALETIARIWASRSVFVYSVYFVVTLFRIAGVPAQTKRVFRNSSREGIASTISSRAAS